MRERLRILKDRTQEIVDNSPVVPRSMLDDAFRSGIRVSKRGELDRELPRFATETDIQLEQQDGIVPDITDLANRVGSPQNIRRKIRNNLGLPNVKNQEIISDIHKAVAGSCEYEEAIKRLGRKKRTRFDARSPVERELQKMIKDNQEEEVTPGI